ncbi:MAG: SDR family oxidoreductase [Spirochaetia bacterium]|nr:SDR family oxidoreductase [Spirochaetia bacterium]
MKPMNDRVALVTGAGSGIGREIALVFAREGAKVAVVDLNESGAKETVSMIEQLHKGKAVFIKADVSKSKEVEAMVKTVIEKFGRIDYAANNAGIEGDQANIIDQTEENWNRVIDINLKGIWLCMKYELPHMLKQKYGAIVNTASVAGLAGFAGITPYTASKHGVVGITRAAALEYAKDGIRINAVCPGVIKTPMIDRFTHGDAEAEKGMIAMEPVGRLGKPTEIAEAVVWLCSDAASFVTGFPMAVDGGFIAA